MKMQRPNTERLHGGALALSVLVLLGVVVVGAPLQTSSSLAGADMSADTRLEPDVCGVTTTRGDGDLKGGGLDCAINGTLRIASLQDISVGHAVQGHDFTIRATVEIGADAVLPVYVGKPVAQDITPRSEDATEKCAEQIAASVGNQTGQQEGRPKGPTVWSGTSPGVPRVQVAMPSGGSDRQYEIYPELYADLGSLGGIKLPTVAQATITMHAPMMKADVEWQNIECDIQITIPVAHGLDVVDSLQSTLTAVVTVTIYPPEIQFPLGSCSAVNDDDLSKETAQCNHNSNLVPNDEFDHPEIILTGPDEYLTYQATFLASFSSLDSYDDDYAKAGFDLSYDDGTGIRMASFGDMNLEAGDVERRMVSAPIAIWDQDAQDICGRISVHDVEQNADLVPQTSPEAIAKMCITVRYDQVAEAGQIRDLDVFDCLLGRDDCGTWLGDLQPLGDRWVGWKLVDSQDGVPVYQLHEWRPA